VEIGLIESLRIKVEESSQTAEARRVARRLADRIGFDEIRAEEVAIVVTEVCTNVLKYAVRGEVLLWASEGCLEMLAVDKGPGITNLDQCLRDGFSTGNSPGQGLGAVTRLSTESDFYTAVNRGTAVLARWCVPAVKTPPNGGWPKLDIGAVNVCMPGEEVCGDAWGVEQTADVTVLLVADGLGHGLEARKASVEAVRVLHLNPNLPPKELLERVHVALRSSRGAAVAIARIDRARGKLTFAGAGNISAKIYSGSQSGPSLVSVNGTAGHQTERLHEFSYPWPEHGMLVLHSDGLTTATGLETHPGLAFRDPSLIAGVLYRDFNRGHDDSTVVVAKGA
jgi:anti-sigma regulatory factor (Ser/Thr protein kinase)